MLFGMNTLGGPRNIVLHGDPDPPAARGGGFDTAFAKLLWPHVMPSSDAPQTKAPAKPQWTRQTDRQPQSQMYNTGTADRITIPSLGWRLWGPMAHCIRRGSMGTWRWRIQCSPHQIILATFYVFLVIEVHSIWMWCVLQQRSNDQLTVGVMVMRVTGWSVNNELNENEESQFLFPRSRCKHAACLHASVVYVFGGKDANIPLNDAWSYDIGEWQKYLCWC